MSDKVLPGSWWQMEPVADMRCSATQVENRTVLQTSSFESYGGFFAALLASYV